MFMLSLHFIIPSIFIPEQHPLTVPCEKFYADLTTVLLVNNDKDNERHGRLINIRPELGILTTTARTFIHEGITTEYATQVVGTTLDKGRLYAQLLKKSSRVLFSDKPQQQPLQKQQQQIYPTPTTVHTSWVGGDLATSILPHLLMPQSHNDLINAAEQIDWHDIDDSLLQLTVDIDSVDDNNNHQNNNTKYKKVQNVYVGNIDYATPLAKFSSSSSSKNQQQQQLQQEMEQTVNANQQLQQPIIEKEIIEKVLPDLVLPTFTVSQSFTPSNLNVVDETPILLKKYLQQQQQQQEQQQLRTPKLQYYQEQFIDKSIKSQPQHQQQPPQQQNIKRHLATTTYFGFADFTTLVGDTLIVFTPSSVKMDLGFGQITSIKGEATLQQEQQPQIQPTTTVNHVNYIEATQLTAPPPETPPTPSPELKQHPKTTTPAILSTTDEDDMKNTENNIGTTTMDTPIKEEEEQQVKVENVKPEPSRVTIGGATTIFFEDDPFTNFIEQPPMKEEGEQAIQQQQEEDEKVIATTKARTPATKPSTIKNKLQSATTTTTQVEEDEEVVVVEEEKNVKDEEEEEENRNTTTEVFIEGDEEHQETTTTSPKEEKEKIQNIEEILPTAAAPVSPSPIRIVAIDEKNVEEFNQCANKTSQIFLTQLAKTQTMVELATTLSGKELKKAGGVEVQPIEVTKLIPTFEIAQATKYYCIQPVQQQPPPPIQEKPPPQQHAMQQQQQNPPINQQPDQEEVLEKKKDNILNIATKITPTPTTRIISSIINDDKQQQIDASEYIDDLIEEQHQRAEGADLVESDGDGDEEEDEEGEEVDIIYKTLYTTFTYLTTYFQGDTSNIRSHTEVVVKVLTTTLNFNDTTQLMEEKENDEREAGGELLQIKPTTTLRSNLDMETSKFMVPTEVEQQLLQQQQATATTLNSSDDDGNDTDDEYIKITNTLYTTYTYYTSVFADNITDLMSHTEIITNYQTKQQLRSSLVKATTTTLYDANKPNEKNITLITDVKTSNSYHVQQQPLTNKQRKQQQQYNEQQQHADDDQISSESNNEHEIFPTATLLLQTSYTTYTYYTTMYSGELTKIASSLDTLTNIVTETLQARQQEQQQPPQTQLNGNSAIDHGVVKNNNSITVLSPITYFTTYTYWTKLSKDGELTTISREETISNIIEPTMTMPKLNDDDIPITVIQPSAEENIVIEPTTYYTTYTYYTTSYGQDNIAITDSRYETITNIVTPTLSDILMPTSTTNEVNGSEQQLKNNKNNYNDDAKFDAYFDDFKKIIDADGVSTLYFSTHITPSYLDNGKIDEIISSTSSLHIDEERKAYLAAVAATPTIATVIDNSNNNNTRMYKTGLVRLIEGTRIANHTITHYQSKVIGTIIDNRYAQIIESTSSFLLPKTNEFLTISKTHQAIVLATTATPTTTPPTIPDTTEEDVTEPITEAITEANKRRINSPPPKIRPFASRVRNQFSPKKKLNTNNVANAATIIRNDITPTITATPALKSTFNNNRFAVSRRNNNNNNNETSSTSTRRFGGNKPFRPISTTPIQSSLRSTNSGGYRIQPTTNSLRSTLKRSGSSSSNIYRNSYKSSIRPTASLDAKAATELVNGFNTTDKESQTGLDGQNSRQSNPLLRFRRPLRPSGFTTSNKKSLTTTTTTTTSTTTRPRYTPRPLNAAGNRPRPQNNLFPPRGLFQPKPNILKQQQQQLEDKNENSEETTDGEAEDAEDYDEDEDETENEDNTKRRRRRRIKRQAATTRNNFRNRLLNRLTTTTEEPYTDPPPPPPTLPHIYGRRRTPGTTTTTPRSALRPTRPTNSRTQFTLRERDTTTTTATTKSARTNFRRPLKASNLNSRTRTNTNTNKHFSSSASNRRLSKAYNSNHNNHNHNKLDKSETTHSSRTTNTNTRRTSNLRGRIRAQNSRDDASNDLIMYNGIITVTHVLPTEITLPVKNGQVTELKQLISTKLSTEILQAKDYSTVLGPNGLLSTLLTRKLTNTHALSGATEITEYLLHDTTTTTVLFTPTSIRGRRTSFAHVQPSTIYSVEPIVSTLPAALGGALNAANAPLANILLSQLLLGGIGLPAAAQIPTPQTFAPTNIQVATPVTEYRTHTTTYVTTLVEGMSTVLPLTFQGKKILTTVYDTTAQTITATELLTDTIVTTPTLMVQQQQQQQQQQQVNGLLLQQLLQQQLQLQTALPNLLVGNEQQQLQQPLPSTFYNDDLLNADQLLLQQADENIQTEETTIKKKKHKSNYRKNGNKRKKQQQSKSSSSIVTLYVSGRRPGEFSTILSTVYEQNNDEGNYATVSLHKRQIQQQQQYDDDIVDNWQNILNIVDDDNHDVDNDDILNYNLLINDDDDNSFDLDRKNQNYEQKLTQSLESYVGDVNKWFEKSTQQPQQQSSTVHVTTTQQQPKQFF